MRSTITANRTVRYTGITVYPALESVPMIINYLFRKAAQTGMASSLTAHAFTDGRARSWM
jgi:hypothetical protein